MKGQYFSFDAIIASVIFVLAIVALLSYWHSVRSFLDFQNDPLSKDAIRVSNLLFTPQSPQSASCGSLDRLGFARSWNDRRVNESIVDCAALQSQAWLRQKLGTAYGTSILITDLSDGSVTTLGGPVPAGTANVVKIRRLATLVNSTGGTTLAAIDLSMYR
ncbi:hypothetical protein L0Y65_00205 [Candidatus Micrarchaeota archaeon]|nr:hypothetical protein [Candidatus Micrarchaeota archaeon]